MRILVTGGNRGIGAGIVTHLAAAGHDVFFSYLKERDRARDIEDECRRHDVRVGSADVDFNDIGAADRLYTAAVEFLGGVDALVNNAGRGFEARLVDLDATDLDSVYSVNFRTAVLLTSMVGRHMIERGWHGSIVNIGSVKATTASPIDLVYGAFKAATQRATQSEALEFAPHGIRVNAVAPGMIAVFEQMAESDEAGGKEVPLGRAGTPEDIARAVEFLLSSNSDYITGVTLCVDGGQSLPATYGGGDIGPDNRWGRSLTVQPTTDFQQRPGLYY